MTATIQVRTDPATKRNAQKILAKLGLDLSTAINIYLVRIIATRGIPFRVVTENGFTPEKERKILKEIEWAKKHGKSYSSVEEMMQDILKD
ncbi:MAG: type II toxin-antitoxin system RelB/DinJ family antitoxin [Candidatus Peribacteraceae bacterium]